MVGQVDDRVLAGDLRGAPDDGAALFVRQHQPDRLLSGAVAVELLRAEEAVVEGHGADGVARRGPRRGRRRSPQPTKNRRNLGIPRLYTRKGTFPIDFE